MQFLKPTRVLFTRNQKLSASQKDDDSIVQFYERLKRLVEDCECTSLTVQAHKDYLVRDALISGLRSDGIQSRLLELEDSKADINSCISLACAIELSSDFSKSFRSAESSTVTAAVVLSALANGDSLVTSGTAQAKIEVNQKSAQVTVTVAKHLVEDVFLGLHVLRQHRAVRLELGGDQPETVLCAGINELVFPEMKNALPAILSSSVLSAKPIATKSRRHKRQDVPPWSPRILA